jgi:Cytochrome c bacterial
MRTLTMILVLLTIAGSLWAGDRPTYTHKEYFEHYEGTQTCLECHQEEGESFFHSQHYQWQGDSPGIVNSDGKRLGKLNTMNDFCTNPMPSWIGNAVNSDGKVLAQGCSKCHAGLGLKPSPVMSQEQLENIDCLICHASGYRRDLYDDDQGNPEWRPILWRNPAGLDAISKRISLPKRKMCLRCHSGAGGGQNFKRGDIEYALADCEPEFDVHMASTGNDMACAECHADSDHRVRGRGADLSGTDAPDNPLRCTSCHDAAPHGKTVLDHHATRIACETCHIPVFAKADATDMSRDWSQPKYHEEANKYSATIEFGKNVVPAYTWWNGSTRSQLMGEAVKFEKDGTVAMMLPQGKRKDKASKIYPFKLHKAVLPILKDEQWLVPLAVDEFFVDGDIEKAVQEGGHAAYGLEHFEYEWINAKRYMGIYHEVQPAANALACLDCHNEGGRMDWKALGYKKDPVLKNMR